VALREGTATDILTGDTDVVVLEHKRTESESFTGGPVETCTGFKTLNTFVDVEFGKTGVDILI
jgi:hypothetical protein